MSYITGDTITVLNDAGETVGINRRVLTHVEQEAYSALLRPVKFRTLMPVGSFGVPEWVQTMEYDVVTRHASWRPVEWAGDSDDISVAEVSIGTNTMYLFAMRSGYKYSDRELFRAQQLKVSLDTERAIAVMQQAQTVLDEIAFKGTASLTDHAIPVATSRVYGLANLPGVTVDTSGAASGSENWDEVVATAMAADPEDLAGAFQGAISTLVRDVIDFETQVYSALKNNFGPDTMLMPESYRPLLKGLQHPFSGRSAESIMLENCSFINRFDYWNRLELGNAAGNGKRVIVYNRSDPRVVRYMLPKEPTPRPPFKREWDTFVGNELVTGGVQTKLPEGVLYFDPPATD